MSGRGETRWAVEDGGNGWSVGFLQIRLVGKAAYGGMGASWEGLRLLQGATAREHCSQEKRDGREIEFVKIYNHSDSSEWSFEESDCEEVARTTIVDSGAMVFDGEQIAAKFDHARSLVFGDGDKAKGGKKARLTMTAVEGAKQGPTPQGAVGTTGSARGAADSKKQQVDKPTDTLAGSEVHDAADAAIQAIQEAERTSALEGRIGAPGQRKVGMGARNADPKKKAQKPVKEVKGRDKAAQIEKLNTAIRDASNLRDVLVMCTSLEDLRENEGTMKTVSNSIQNKEDMLLMLEMDDKLAEYRYLSKLCLAMKEGLRSWKATSHTGNQNTLPPSDWDGQICWRVFQRQTDTKPRRFFQRQPTT